MLDENIYSFPSTSILYSFPYLALAVVACIFLWKDTRKTGTKAKYVFLFLLFLWFFGFRWHIMSDSLAYEEEFNRIQPVFTWKYIEINSWWWDKGFVIFTMLCKLINPSFSFWVFVNALIDICLFTWCVKKYSINYLITILAFLAFNGLLMEINLFRNMKAILLFLASLSYIRDRKLIPFLALNIIGFTMHSSALVFIPMYWILHRQYSFKLLLGAAIVFTIIYLLRINLLEDYIIQYIPMNGAISDKMNHYLKLEESVLTIGTLERLLTLSLGLWFYYKEKDKSPMFIIVFNSFLIFYAFYGLFGFNQVFRDRFPTLFQYSYWFLYPYLYAFYTKKESKIKPLFFLLFFLKIYTSTNTSAAYYENIMFDTTTRQERTFLLDHSGNN